KYSPPCLLCAHILGSCFLCSLNCELKTENFLRLTAPTPSRPDHSPSQTSRSPPAFLNPLPPLCCLRSLPQTPSTHLARSKFPPCSSPVSVASLLSSSSRPAPPVP